MRTDPRSVLDCDGCRGQEQCDDAGKERPSCAHPVLSSASLCAPGARQMTGEPVREFDHMCRDARVRTLESFLPIAANRIGRAGAKESEDYEDSPTNGHQPREQIQTSM